MASPSLDSKKRKAAALQDRSNNKASSPKRKAKSTPLKSTTQPRSISKIVDDVFSKATDAYVEKQRHGSTAASKRDVRKEITRHFRPKPKAEPLDDDEVSVHDEPVDDAEDPENHDHGSPGPLFKAANSKLGGKAKGKGKTRSASTKSASPKPGKPVRFGHVAFLPVAPKADRAGIPTLRLPNLIHLSALREAGLVIDPVPGDSDLTIPVTAKQPDISAYLKQRLPTAFQHLPGEHAWQLLVVASKKLANFGSKRPSGADFGTVVGAQKGAQVIEKTVFIAPRKSFPKKVIALFKPPIEAVVEHLQSGTVPTRRSKRLSVGDSDSESESNSAADSENRDGSDIDNGNDDGDDQDGNNQDGDDHDGDEEEDDGNEDVDVDADVEAEDGDVEGDGKIGNEGGNGGSADPDEDDDDSDGSASICPPKKKRRISPTAANRKNGQAFDNLWDSELDGMDGDPVPAIRTPPRSRRTFKGKENSAIYVPSSSPSSEQDNLWFNAANYEPKMPFLNLP
ncbi:hypothetical protein M407DRAFT_12126 [Tulasnella calospora MUT 4182]|uniref:Uncharacterized protein n=1 Tax=Tulasnella calospora MUT 4182 TaxID=1051891 RepID=A0A0C3K945_9AGAM|nr:hypothetical protein M407DRAFT_12126 [Tulasnella calospora MUT 4182]